MVAKERIADEGEEGERTGRDGKAVVYSKEKGRVERA
jgi:hypothetical protein